MLLARERVALLHRREALCAFKKTETGVAKGNI